MEEEKKIFKDPFDGEYIGNIWGWKFSFIGLGMILFLLGIMAYRHYTMEVPLGFDEIDAVNITDDTTKIENEVELDSIQ